MNWKDQAESFSTMWIFKLIKNNTAAVSHQYTPAEVKTDLSAEKWLMMKAVASGDVLGGYG